MKNIEQDLLENLHANKIDELFSRFKDLIFPEEEYEYEEIFPKVLIYKNIFSSPEKITKILKESSLEPEESFYFKDWSQWGGFDSSVIFGKYVLMIGKDFNNKKHLLSGEEKDLYLKKAREEFSIIIEVVKGFFAATNHFMKKYDIKKGESWTHTPPSFCRYMPNNDLDNELFMQFHTDYIIDRASEPGDKFAITTTMYFNDDYDGGEIVFKIKNKKFAYKPKAGDLLVFPSGHPSVLMQGEDPIMHAVNPIGMNGPDRYIVRMFHQIRSEGDDVQKIIADNILKGQQEGGN